MKNVNILIVGVGGQGTLLASTILGRLALNAGKDVKLSEVHGMAQRGGSVVTHVAIGDKVNSPILDKGGADIILAFEILEAMRWVAYLKKGGKMYVNTQEILPMPVITGNMEYPKNPQEQLQEQIGDVRFADALSLAKEAGSVKAVNTVMLGVLAKDMDLTKEQWFEAMQAVVKPQFLEMNKKAFLLGYGE